MRVVQNFETRIGTVRSPIMNDMREKVEELLDAMIEQSGLITVDVPAGIYGLNVWKQKLLTLLGDGEPVGEGVLRQKFTQFFARWDRAGRDYRQGGDHGKMVHYRNEVMNELVALHLAPTNPERISSELVEPVGADQEAVGEIFTDLYVAVNEEAQRVLNVLSWYVGGGEQLSVLVKGLRFLVEEWSETPTHREPGE